MSRCCRLALPPPVFRIALRLPKDVRRDFFTADHRHPSDRDLQHRVALFVQQRRLSQGARLTITARRGVVTLAGRVPTFHQRQLLYSLTRHVAGVVLVQDELDVATEDDSALPVLPDGRLPALAAC